MKRIQILKIFSILQLLLSYQVYCRIDVKLTNFQCKSLDQKLGYFEKCLLKAVKRDVTEISVYFRLQKFINNTSIDLKLIKRGAISTKPIYQYKVDLCEFMRNKRRNPLAELFYNMFGFSKYSNMNHSCPYDHDLIVDRCRLDTKLLSMLSVAQGEYTITTNWFVQQKPALSVNCSVGVF